MMLFFAFSSLPSFIPRRHLPSSLSNLRPRPVFCTAKSPSWPPRRPPWHIIKLSAKPSVPPNPKSNSITDVVPPTILRRELINRVLASQRASLIVVVASGVMYAFAIVALAYRLSLNFLPPSERVFLLALALIVPDFRHTVRQYLTAVKHLSEYKPIDTSLKAPKAISLMEEIFLPNAKVIEGIIPMDKIRLRLDEFDNLISRVSRPIEAVSGDILSLVGTDLTLRKNIIVAAAAIILSLLACFIAAAIENAAPVGAAIIMIASLLPSAIIIPRKHEVLTLINDARLLISMLGILAAVAAAFIPVTASYIFLACSMGLVAVHAPQYGI